MLNTRSDIYSNYRQYIDVGIIALLSVLIYFNSLSNGFSYDDFQFVVNNPAVHGFSVNNLYNLFTSVPNNMEFLPVKDLSYCLDTMLSGLNPTFMHLSNLVWYLLASIAFYFFVTRLIEWWDINAENLALICTILFVAHPMHVASVASICQRKDLVSGLLLFISLNLYLSFRSRGGMLLYFFSLAVFILSIFSKATVMTIPLFVIVLEWFTPLEKRSTGVRAILLSAPFFLIVVAFIRIESVFLKQTGVLSQLFSSTVSWPARLATAAVAVFYYLKMMIMPYPLLLLHDFGFVKNIIDPVTILSGVGCLALAAALIFLRKRAPFVGSGLLLILVTLIPVSGIVPSNTLIAERYLFLPLAGFVMIIGAAAQWVLQKGGNKRLIGTGTIVLLLTVYSSITIQRNPDWRDNLTLLLANARDLPGKPGVYYQIGAEYFTQGKHPQAFAYLSRATELNPFYSIHYTVYQAMASYMRGDTTKTKQILDTSTYKFKHYVAEVNYLYGKIRQSAGDLENAALYYRNASKSAMPLGVVEPRDIADAQASLGRSQMASR